MRPAAPVPHVCRPRTARTRLGRAAERAAAAFTAPVALAGAFFALGGSKLFMPGVIVETAPTASPADNQVAPGAPLFLVGLCDRGSATGVESARSYTEFVAKCGPYATYGALHDQVKLYFQMGGNQVHVARVVGGSATAGTLMLQDRNDTPANTLKIDAVSPGAWSSNIEIEIVDGELDDSYTIKVYVDGATVPTEVFANLADPAAAVAALAGSGYVRGTDQSSATTAPDNNPDVLTKTPLSAGSDDRGTVNAAALVAALARFTKEFGTGIVAIPGQDSSTVGAGLIAHCRSLARLCVLATTKSASVATAKSAASAFAASNTGAEHAILAYPWIHVDDGAGGTRSISPEGYVAGARARAHIQVGPWKAAAGEISKAPQVLDVETDLTEAEGEELNAARVAAIRKISGSVQLYGYRTLSLDQVHYLFLTTRDVLNYVAHRGRRALEPMVFGVVDSRGQFQAQVETAIIAILDPMLVAGGLYEIRDPTTGNVTNPAYAVDAGPGVNTPAQIAAGVFACNAVLRVSGVAETIRLLITSVGFEETI